MIKYGLWLLFIYCLCALFSYLVGYDLVYFLCPFFAFLFCNVICKLGEDKIYMSLVQTVVLLIHEIALCLAYLTFTYTMWGGREAILVNQMMSGFFSLIALCLCEVTWSTIMLATYNKRNE